jgi:hypothetical protein
VADELNINQETFKEIEMISSNLCYDLHVLEDHMNEKINKSNSIMGLIRRTFTYIDTPTFLMLYKALVRPHLEYAKLIPGFKDMTYENRLRKLKLPTLAYPFPCWSIVALCCIAYT